MLVMAAAFGVPALSGIVGPVALIFTLLYVLSFALGTGPVPGLLAAELLPVSIRGGFPTFPCVRRTVHKGSSVHVGVTDENAEKMQVTYV